MPLKDFFFLKNQVPLFHMPWEWGGVVSLSSHASLSSMLAPLSSVNTFPGHTEGFVLSSKLNVNAATLAHIS